MTKRILVVDDQQGILDILCEFLSKEGFEVLAATDGNSALRLAKKFPPDLMILDVIMPEMDGGQVMANILEDEKLKNIPVVFLTGAVTEQEAIESNRHNTGRLYISKASDIREQGRIIKKALGV